MSKLKVLQPDFGDNSCRPDFCRTCPIAEHTRGYVPLQRGSSSTLLVGEASGANEADLGKPFVGGAGSWLNNLLRAAGIKRENLNVINTIGCQPRDNVYPTDRKWRWTSREAARTAVTYCNQHHLQPALEQLSPTKIIALGDQALIQLTGRRGITVWRGSPLPALGDNTRLAVLPTLHPAYLMRDAKFTSVAIADLKKPLEIPPEFYELYFTAAGLSNFSSSAFAFDFEWDRNENITICGLSSKLYHAEVGTWSGESILQFKRIFESATDLIGHNIIGADTKYFERLGWKVPARMHDTMLKQHLVQPAFRHSLAFVSSVFTNKPFWKGRGEEKEDNDGNIIEAKEQWKTWDKGSAIPRELGGYGGCTSADEAYRLYNARDTDASYQINAQLDSLLRRYQLEGVYWNVSVPIAYIARDLSDHGLAINTALVKQVREDLGNEITELEQTLPDGLRPYQRGVTRQIPAPEGTYAPKTLKCKGTKKAQNSHDPISWEVCTVGESRCPTCSKVFSPKLAQRKRIKVPGVEIVKPWNSSPQVMAYARSLGLKINVKRERGTESADVNARKVWGRTNPEFRIIDRLKDLGTERNNFAKQSILGIDRLFFNLNVHGTSEGRFSSSGKREGVDPNIQNQPKSIRKIYIPDQPEWSFIELDYASGENMLTAFLARDMERLERLRTPGYSEHLELTRKIFNLPSITKAEATEYGPDKLDLYDIGKHINHGSNYGMTYIKLKEYLEMNGFFYSDKDCKEFMAAGKALNPRTAKWQLETIECARRDGFLRNPFGRMLWFSTRDIATKSLAFLPASTLADIIIRAMIGHYPQRFPNECAALGLSVTGSIVSDWLMSIQVHDSLVLQGPHEFQLDQARRSKAIMEQPWKELDGFALGVEVKTGLPGGSWGSLKVATV